jgi:hypothetical protein
MMTYSLESADRTLGRESALEAALARRGWQPDGMGWRLPLRGGAARLEEIGRCDWWRQFQLSGGAIARIAAKRVLADNARLFGPGKWVVRPGRRPICRIDVPDELRGSARENFDSDAPDPLDAWAGAATSAAIGQAESGADADARIEARVEEITEAGWSASVDNGQLHVNLETRGGYRQLALERDPVAGVKLATDLVEMQGLDDACLEAMALLANEANARLPLVRFAIHSRAGRAALGAEVGFGRTLVGGTWLVAALCVLETAVSLTARELESLRDTELATLLLAASGGRESCDQEKEERDDDR